MAHRRRVLDAVLKAAGVDDVSRRETLVLALYGALWYRLLPDEPVADRFAGRMAVSSTVSRCDTRSTG